MGKHRKVKRNWQSIEIDLTFSLSAGITAKDLVASLISETADDNFIMTSLEATYALTFEQAAEPNSVEAISIGIAKDDYSAAEVETWVENSTGFKRADLISQEISKRMVKQIATFVPPTVAAGQQVVVSLNDGMPIKTRLNWRILTGHTLLIWLYNGGDVNIGATSGQNLRVMGQMRGFWED